MMTARSRLFFGLFWALVLVVGAGLVWANWTFARANPLDSPYLVQWAGIRGLVTNGVSPYDPSSWQIASLLAPENSEQDRFIFSQPFYVVFLLLPFALIPDITTARAAWMLALELALAGSLLLLPGLRQWRAGRVSFVLLVGFVFLGLHSIQALAAGSSAILAGLFLLLALSAMRKGWDEAAGLALVMATIQPEATFPAVLFILLWGLADRRGMLVAWFIGGLVLLSLAAMFLLPGWPSEYLRLLFQHWSDFPGETLAGLFNQALPGIGVQLTWGVRLGIIVLLLFEWFAARRKDFDWFLWTTGLTITLTPWLGLPTNAANLVLLIFPVFLFQSVWDERIGRKDHWLPLLVMLILWLGLWGLALLRVLRSQELSSGFLIPLPFMALICLYWVRWWYIRPLRLYQDPLRKHEALR